jgi:hypothetical protein
LVPIEFAELRDDGYYWFEGDRPAWVAVQVSNPNEDVWGAVEVSLDIEVLDAPDGEPRASRDGELHISQQSFIVEPASEFPNFVWVARSGDAPSRGYRISPTLAVSWFEGPDYDVVVRPDALQWDPYDDLSFTLTMAEAEHATRFTWSTLVAPARDEQFSGPGAWGLTTDPPCQLWEPGEVYRLPFTDEQAEIARKAKGRVKSRGVLSPCIEQDWLKPAP